MNGYRIALTVAAALVVAPAVHADADVADAVRDLGVPITSITIADDAYGYGPDGEPWLYVVLKGHPAMLNIIEIETGKLVNALPLEGAHISWGLDTTPDGTLYMGTANANHLYRYVPGADHVEDLGPAIPGESHHWRLDTDEQGRVYSGTYPSGKIFQYDPETGKFRDYGRLLEGEDYGHSIAAGGGMVYAGSGTRTGRIFAIDPDTGDKQTIPMPQGYEDSTDIYHLDFRAGLLFAQFVPSNDIRIYDISTGQWLEQTGVRAMPSPVAPDGRTVYFVSSGELFTFDVQTHEVASTGFHPGTGSAYDYGWFELNQPEFPGKSLVSSNIRGQYFVYNPATGNGWEHRRPDIQPTTVNINSLHTGPDGRVYIGGFLSPGMMAAYDPETGEFTTLRGMAQIEGFGSHAGRLYMGVYPGAHIDTYDPDQPWKAPENPRRLFSLRDHGQTRPFAFAPADDRIVIGTIADYGHLEGAVTLYNPQTGETDTHVGLIPDQSIASVAWHDGLVIGGTTITGGLGTESTTTEGRLFIFDPQKGEVLWDDVPIPGAEAVTGLTVDEQGMVWGVAGQYVFRFDPDTRRVVREKDLLPDVPPSNPKTIWRNGTLSFHDGQLYGVVEGRIFHLDPETWEHRILIEGVGYAFAQDRAGNLYFADGDRLLCLPFDALR